MAQRDYSSGISNCHFAVRGIQPGTLKSLPGAIKLSFKPSAEGRSFIVRDGANAYSYTSSRGSRERRAELEIVGLTKDFLVDVLGYTENEDGSLTEGIQPDVHISLFYETENGGRPVRTWLYDCVVCAPSFDASTLGSRLSADTRKLDIIVDPDRTHGGAYSRSIARADNAELFSTWFGLTE